MKKLLIILAFISFFQISLCSTAYIASFNVNRLGKKIKNYKILAKIISHFDIVALQEVSTKQSLVTLSKNLKIENKSNWKFLISNISFNSYKYKEYYAFIWKNKKVKLIKSLGIYPNNGKYQFKRPPFGALFKIKNFDFILVNFHIIYGKTILQREKEVSQLPNVYKYFSKLAPKEKDILLIGDFNLESSDFFISILHKNKPNLAFTLSNDTKTTIGNKKLISGYDKILITKFTKEFKKAGIIKIKNINLKYFKKYISDHVPVFGVFTINSDDD